MSGGWLPTSNCFITNVSSRWIGKNLLRVSSPDWLERCLLEELFRNRRGSELLTRLTRKDLVRGGVSDVMRFSTIAALKEASNPEPGALAYLLGYHEIDDGGGGVFRWDGSGDPSQNDGGLWIASQEWKSGVWRRLTTDGLQPVTFWAGRGDGKTGSG